MFAKESTCWAFLRGPQCDAPVNRCGFQNDVEALSVLVLESAADTVEVALSVIGFIDVIGDVARLGFLRDLRRLFSQRRRSLGFLIITHGMVS